MSSHNVFHDSQSNWHDFLVTAVGSHWLLKHVPQVSVQVGRVNRSLATPSLATHVLTPAPLDLLHSDVLAMTFCCCTAGEGRSYSRTDIVPEPPRSGQLLVYFSWCRGLSARPAQLQNLIDVDHFGDVLQQGMAWQRDQQQGVLLNFVRDAWRSTL